MDVQAHLTSLYFADAIQLGKCIPLLISCPCSFCSPLFCMENAEVKPGSDCALGTCHPLCVNPCRCVEAVISWPVCVAMVKEACGLVAGRNVPVCDCWLAGHNGSEDPVPERFQEDIVLEKIGTWNSSESKPNKNISCFCPIKHSSLMKSQKCLWLHK